MSIIDLPSFFFQQIREVEEEHDRVYEAVIGVVTDNKDPDKLARVKVKFPALSADDNSWWAPIISVGAGKSRGWFFIPEVDDEVMLAYEHGDPNRPIVLGAIWNGKDKPPDNNKSGDNPRRVIKSREGSRVLFDDDLDKIVIEDGKGKGRITLDAKNNKIIIEALEGDVAFQAPKGELKFVTKETEIKAGQNFEANIGTTLAVGTDAQATIEGTSLLQLTGGPMVNLNSGGQAPEKATAEPKEVPDKYGS
ncbi:MAG TPA: phage baseplate assembly protein V [Kofleriaceae bacterium]|nr:phage baseplate assembly protein V [Kofleriaceae bacterium]